MACRASAGACFEDARGQDSLGFLVHATAAGHVSARRGPPGALLALANGRLEQLAFHGNGHQYADSYAAASLRRTSSAKISDSDRIFAGTGVGLIVLNEPCTHLVCASATVSKLAANGAVVTLSAGHMFLVRVSSPR